MTRFTVKFEDGETRTITAKYIKPEIVRGWWTYDKEGEQPYVYKMLDENSNKEKVYVPLGDTMYFHVEVKGIKVGEEIELQLFDYDELFWKADILDPDDSKFPNDPVTSKEKIKQVGDKRIVTIEVKLEDSWEPVIQDDHDGYMASRDQTIELYWKISYKNLSEEFPKDENDDRLRVGYNEQDLFIKPIVEGTGLPEFYDNKGKLMIFGFKMFAKVSKELNPNPYFSSLFISTVRITETSTLTEINKVKKTLLYERVSWDTNESVRYGYKSVQSSNYVIKGEATFKNVNQFEIQKTKKFSDYFNRRDLRNGSDILIKQGREALRILDFINASKTVHSIFKEPEKGLQIPKPSSVVSAMGLFSAIRAVSGFGALSPLFMTADVIATKVVNEIINEFTEESRLAWEHRKMAGLKSALTWVKNENAGAKMLGLKVIEYVCQEAYEKVLCKEIKTLPELRDYEAPLDAGDNNYYTCFYYEKTENGREKYLIDCFVLN